MASTSTIIDSKICRICMVNVNLQPISTFHDELDNETIDLSHKLKICCNVDVNPEDKMPKHICKLCFDVLTAAYDLVMLCKQTNDTLRKYIGVDGRIQGTEETNQCTKYSEESDYCDVEYLSDSDGEYKPDIIHEKSVNVIRNEKQIHWDSSNKNIHSNKILNINEINILKENNRIQKSILTSQDMQRNLKQEIYKTCSINKSIVLNNSIQQSPESNDSKKITINTLNNPLSHDGKKNENKPLRYLVSFGGKKLLMEPVNNSESHDNQKTVKIPKRYLMSLGDKKILIKSWDTLKSCGRIEINPVNVNSKTPTMKQDQSNILKESNKIADMSKESNNMSQESSNNMSQESTNNMSQESSNNMSQESSNNMSNKESNNIADTSRKEHTDKIEESFDSDEDLWRHTFIPTPEKKRQSLGKELLCEKCAYYNTNRTLFQRHVLTHQPKTLKQCPLCPYKTTCQDSFTEHMRYTHQGIPLKQCDKCPYTTNSRSSFYSHMIRHSGEKKYSCKICSYKTYYSGKLRTHMVTHTNERKYKCDQCGADYKDKNSLRSHILRAHQNMKNYRCKSCRLTYIGEESYERHLRKHAENKITKKPRAIRKRYKSKTTKDNMEDNDKSKETDKEIDVS